MVTQEEYIEIQPMIEYIDEMKHIVYRGESCVDAASVVVLVRGPWESSGGDGGGASEGKGRERKGILVLVFRCEREVYC